MQRLLLAVLAAGAVVLGACGGTETDPDPNPTTPTCGASNCAGCCFNNVCQTGTTATACGKGGATCGTCSAQQVCRTDQTCGLDPEATWKVEPVRAKVNTSDPAGAAWDPFGGAPDPYAGVACPSPTPQWVVTAYATDTFEPTWSAGAGCTAKAKLLMQDGFAFQLADYDDGSGNDAITDVLIAKPTEAILSAGTVTMQASGGMESVTFKFTKQ